MKQLNSLKLHRIVTEALELYIELNQDNYHFFSSKHGLMGQLKSEIFEWKFQSRMDAVQDKLSKGLIFDSGDDPLVLVLNLIKHSKRSHDQYSQRAIMAYKFYTLLEMGEPITMAELEATGQGSKWHDIRDRIYDTFLPVSESQAWRRSMGANFLEKEDIDWAVAKFPEYKHIYEIMYERINEAPGVSQKNCLEVLSLASEASTREIKKAYHKFSKKLHPDKAPNDLVAAELFKIMNVAYNYLLQSEAEKQSYQKASVSAKGMKFWRSHAADYGINISQQIMGNKLSR